MPLLPRPPPTSACSRSSWRRRTDAGSQWSSRFTRTSSRAEPAATQRTGAPDLQLPDELREPLIQHLADLKERYIARNWAGRVGFGQRPALLVIDLALFWTRPDTQMGSSVDSVVEATCPRRAMDRRPLYQVSLSLQSAAEVDLPLEGLVSTPISVDLGVAECDLTLSFTAFDEGLSAQYRYCTDLFDRPTIEAFAGRVEQVLEAAVANPGARLSMLAG